MKNFTVFFVVVLMLIPTIVYADAAGTIVAVKGTVIIHRDSEDILAQLKDKVLPNDVIETKEASRVKMLFSDDSILTLAANSKVSIKEYFYSETSRKGKSIINLIDGKLRSLVGNTEFEVHTPTMIAAARGTYFISWTEIEEGIPTSGTAVLEGLVDVFNIDPAIVGVVTLQQGTMSKTAQNRQPSPPLPTPPALLKELINATELKDIPKIERRPPPPVKKPVQQALPPTIKDERNLPPTPPIDNQIPPNTTPVRIRIPIPEDL
jgi:hypothetical protein